MFRVPKINVRPAFEFVRIISNDYLLWTNDGNSSLPISAETDIIENNLSSLQHPKRKRAITICFHTSHWILDQLSVSKSITASATSALLCVLSRTCYVDDGCRGDQVRVSWRGRHQPPSTKCHTRYQRPVKCLVVQAWLIGKSSWIFLKR